MRTRRLIVLFMMLAIFSTSAMSNYDKGWEKVGSMLIDRKSDHSTIFDPYVWDHSFRMIKLTLSKGGPVRFTRIVVTYGDNTVGEIQFTDLVPVNGSSKELTLNGDRHIKRVDFWYDKSSLVSKTVRVDLWGFSQ